jgi:ligand-binding sensor domain-containing protein
MGAGDLTRKCIVGHITCRIPQCIALVGFVVTGLLLAMVTSVRAQHLPIKTYTIADGLAHDVINRIVRDSHGYLWFCTHEGLSRFDGYTFTNYGRAQGLLGHDVNDMVET